MCADKENITRKIKLNASLQFSTITNPPTTIEHGKQRKQFNVYEQHPTKKETKSNTIYRLTLHGSNARQT